MKIENFCIIPLLVYVIVGHKLVCWHEFVESKLFSCMCITNDLTCSSNTLIITISYLTTDADTGRVGSKPKYPTPENIPLAGNNEGFKPESIPFVWKQRRFMQAQTNILSKDSVWQCDTT